MEKGAHLLFSGEVQGVGFRFTAKSLANRHKIKGWVKNISGSKVEMMVEGKEKNINIFLNDLKNEFQRNIIDIQLDYVESSGTYSDFQIKF